MKVLIELDCGCSFIADIDPKTKLTENFDLYELANNQGDPKLPQFIFNSKVDKWLTILQRFRKWFNKPMNPNCGYRQPKYNDSLPGAVKNSLHKLNLAMDWDISMYKFNDTQYMNCARQFKKLCEAEGIIGEINFYPKYIHLGVYASINGHKTFQCRDYRKPTAKSKFTLVKVA